MHSLLPLTFFLRALSLQLPCQRYFVFTLCSHLYFLMSPPASLALAELTIPLLYLSILFTTSLSPHFTIFSLFPWTPRPHSSVITPGVHHMGLTLLYYLFLTSTFHAYSYDGLNTTLYYPVLSFLLLLLISVYFVTLPISTLSQLSICSFLPFTRSH